jgi:hypothetical protein
VWLEGLDQLKNPMTSLGIKPETFQLVALVPQPTTLMRAHINFQFQKIAMKALFP